MRFSALIFNEKEKKKKRKKKKTRSPFIITFPSQDLFSFFFFFLEQDHFFLFKYEDKYFPPVPPIGFLVSTYPLSCIIKSCIIKSVFDHKYTKTGKLFIKPNSDGEIEDINYVDLKSVLLLHIVEI